MATPAHPRADTSSNSLCAGTPLPYWTIAILSGLALAFEVLLTRLFAIVQWHHFAYMVISLALLGYGASGTFLMLFGQRARDNFGSLFVTNALLFGLSTVGSFLLAQRLPFNPLELAWEQRQMLYLLAYYLLLAIPFFCVANAIGLALIRAGDQVHRVYAFDLIGAGAGAVAAVLLLYAASPAGMLWIIGGLGVLAALAACIECRVAPRKAQIGVVACAVLAGLLVPTRWGELHPSEYKDLSQALRVTGAELLIQRSGPLGQVSVVRNSVVPVRYAPGLSLLAPVSPPDQMALFSDGGALGVISRFSGSLVDFEFTEYQTSALPYRLLTAPRVLILGAGGGADVLQAIYHGAASVDAVELNPQIVHLVRNELGDFAGGVYERSGVHVHVAEARSFVATTADNYDLIQVALLDAFSTASAGLYALSESYLYTVEAFEQYLGRLRPHGILAITRWLRTPPRDSLKLFATAVLALERAGVADPGSRLILIRGWNTTTLLVKNEKFSEPDVAAVRTFLRTRAFDPVYYPGMSANEANRFNILDRPYLREGALAVLGPSRGKFFRDYKFDVRPVTDDRPYFFHFLKWGTLPELISMPAGGGLGNVEWGYLVLVATLVQALLVSGLLVLLPLWFVRGSTSSMPTKRSVATWRVLAYFVSIGLGFLFLEVAFIQKLVLFLGHPLYAVSVVLSAFLMFAGVGSASCKRLRAAGKTGLGVVVGMLGVTALTYNWMLQPLFEWGFRWPEGLRILIAAALIAPLAFCMGMPFPLGVAWLSECTPWRVPWAWAINGCASVVSAVLATVLAVQIGFSGVIIAAVVLYAIAVLAAPCPDGSVASNRG